MYILDRKRSCVVSILVVISIKLTINNERVILESEMIQHVVLCLVMIQTMRVINFDLPEKDVPHVSLCCLT